MSYKPTAQVRREFLEYFRSHQHMIVRSSPCVPHEDPTLLFTNAGMNQFKDVFLGTNVRDYTCAATAQKCIRAGGKHNDLENVGHTSRHLTFFEMLGNFSFNAYFKERAIHYAWDVATHIFGFAPDKIWPTVFKEDEEAYELWKRYVHPDRITRLGEKENFWAMGDSGPCGPCSELLYDRGAAFGNAKSPLEDTTGERYLEFWNLVFMQYNTIAGHRTPLPKPAIDTGAGLERVMSLIQGTNDVYETDVLRALIAEVENITGRPYEAASSIAASFRVIADHIRSLAFAIADGAAPGNTDRGYVLRKIIRRAVRYGKNLGLTTPFLSRLLPRLIDCMGEEYPELTQAQARIEELLFHEEEGFFRTLARGGTLLSHVVEQSLQTNAQISARDAFTLKDTYGMPLDEIVLVAKDNQLTVDVDGFAQLEEEAKEKSRKAHKTHTQITSSNSSFEALVRERGPTLFLRERDTCQATIVAILVDGTVLDSIPEGAKAQIILDTTSFYGELGGQAGDSGSLSSPDTLFNVQLASYPYKGIVAHDGILTQGTLRKGDRVTCAIDTQKRRAIERNHTATHLLHWALAQVLGDHAQQAGSFIDEERLRFDVRHHKPLHQDQLRAIEGFVNEKIRENIPVQAYEMSYEEVQKRSDIKQFFGDKYDTRVRVLDIAPSKELCGGTHVQRTGDIGYVRITHESSIASGVRRIEAVSGPVAEQFAYKKEDLLLRCLERFKASEVTLEERVEKMFSDYDTVSKKLFQCTYDRLTALAATLKTTNNVHCHLVQTSSEDLKVLADILSKNEETKIIALMTYSTTTIHIIVRMSKDLVLQGQSCENIVQELIQKTRAKGGGKKEYAQAVIPIPNEQNTATLVPEVLSTLRSIVSRV